MDLTYPDLETKAIAMLHPFVTQSAEEFTHQCGEVTYQKVRALFLAIQAKLTENQDATATFQLFQKKPEFYWFALKSILQEHLAEDTDFAENLRELLQDGGPVLTVEQHIEEGQDITGVKAQEIRAGKMDITQRIGKAHNVIGLDVDHFGR